MFPPVDTLDRKRLDLVQPVSLLSEFQDATRWIFEMFEMKEIERTVDRL